MPNTESAHTTPVDPKSTSTPLEVSCCGGPAPEGASACCVRDADVKAAGGAGCGCGSREAAPSRTRSSCC